MQRAGGIVFAFAFACTFTSACSCASRPAVGTSTAPAESRGIELTYLGTAGWELRVASSALLVDPYFTRVDVDDEDAPLAPNEALVAKIAPTHADAILIGHSHHDHLLDAPFLAKRTGAKLVGSESTLNVGRAAGVREDALVHVSGGESIQIGPFAIRVLRGLHSGTGAELATIKREIHLPLRKGDYAIGTTLQYLVRAGGHEVLFIGSANFIEDELAGVHPSVAIVATALREEVPDYTCRLMRVLGSPPVVLTNHFDAHWEPLGPKQLELDEDERRSLTSFADEVHSCSPNTKVIVPEHFRTMAF